MDQRAIIDVVCKAGVENLAGEVGALLGQELICSDVQLNLTTKEDLFSDIERHKTALTRMTVDGDLQGDCFLLTRMSTAVILGGTLIMLPEDVIEESAQNEKLDGELDDAFGEVANIIAGVFTQAFVDKYKKNLRFIKKTVEELIPTKIDPSSDDPFPPGNYHVSSCNMKVGDKDLGPLEFVVPASIFDLEEAPADPVAAAEETSSATTPEPTPEVEPVAAPEAAAEPTTPPEPQVEAAPPAPPKKPPFADAKKLADVVFNATIAQVGEEIGALLGQPLKCDDIQLVMTTKAEFFSDHCVDKSILTHMKVTGDREGLGFMAIQIPDAIVLGGTLIMLPEDQIAEQKGSGSFEGEVEDAYGEIANILSGGLTQTFLDRYPQQLRFIKTEAETVVPTKVDIDSDQPFPEGKYYLASFAIHLEGHELHRILLIFPAEVFDLDDIPAATAQPTAAATSGTAATSAADNSQADSGSGDGPAPGEWGGPPLPSDETATQPAQGATQTPPQDSVTSQGGTVPAENKREAAATTQSPPEPTGTPVVLVISDQKSDADPFVEILTSADYESRVLTFQDEVKELFQQHKILGILLVMAQVGEKGFASAIKLQSAGRPLPPIIFAGPEWTRSAVLRAVKYGAKDILVTPASGDEIQDKVSRHFQKAS